MISTRFSVAIHILVMLDNRSENRSLTSEYIAQSVGTNPVVVRRIMSVLKKKGLIYSAPGIGDSRLLKNSEDISLYDVYQALDFDGLFSVHTNTNPSCKIGANIHNTLNYFFDNVTLTLLNDLKTISLAHIKQDLNKRKG